MRRLVVSLFFVGCLGGFAFVSGCDRPERGTSHYGTIVDRLPDLPEAKEQFDIPDIEGIDREDLMRKRY